MRRTGFLIPCLAILLTACNEGVNTGMPVDASTAGKVTFSLSADMRNDVTSVKSSAEDISVDDFWVEIFNSSKMRIFCEKYVDAKDTTLFVNSGDYTLLATYGTDQSVGFDKPFYKAEEFFTVGPQEARPVSATATLANVKVAVNFDDDLDNKLSYEQYWAVVRNNGKKLRFNPTETRAGYIPAGELEFVLVVKINGEYKQYVHPAAEYAPNDFVTYNVSAPLLDGSVTVKVLVDDTVEVVEVDEVTVPLEDMLPLEEPAIYSEGFDNDNSITYVDTKAQKKNAVWLSASAEGVLSSAVLSIDCGSLGLPESVDLVTADAATVSAFEAKGIWWKFNADMTSLSLDLTDAYNEQITKNGYVGYDHDAGRPLPVARIGLKIETSAGAVRTAEEQYAVYAEPCAAVGTISWNDYDVWAWKIVDPTLNLGEGTYNKTKIQYSVDGSSWNDLQTVNSANHSMGTVEGLAPGTTYHLRAMYDGWLEVAPPVSFTTESAQQIPDNGFENWTTENHEFTYDLKVYTKRHDVNWYYPSSGWAVNSKKTMPSTTWVASAYWEFVRFPMVAYVYDSAVRGNVAMVYSVSVGDGASPSALGSTKVAGEMWTGTATASGDHDSDVGLALGSRPASMTVSYKYKSVNGETFVVNAKVKDKDGNTIATASTDSGPASDDWTTLQMIFDYSVSDRKAAAIYMQFKSTGNSTPEFDKGSYITVTAGEIRGNFGSVLHLDDIVMNYSL